MQAPGGPEEDPTGGFEYGGWTVGYWDDFLGNVMAEKMAKPFDLLLGRKTYEIFAAHWPYADGNDPIAGKLNSTKKYVVSTTLEKLDWSNSSLVKGDIVQQIKKLKQQNGPQLQVHGSGNLIQTLLKHDLIDELALKIFPITLGALASACLAMAQFLQVSGSLIAELQPQALSLPLMSEQEMSRKDHLPWERRLTRN